MAICGAQKRRDRNSLLGDWRNQGSLVWLGMRGGKSAYLRPRLFPGASQPVGSLLGAVLAAVAEAVSAALAGIGDGLWCVQRVITAFGL